MPRLDETFKASDYEKKPKDPNKESDYLKFINPDTKIRILTSPIRGYEYFKEDDKPVRSRTPIRNPV